VIDFLAPLAFVLFLVSGSLLLHNVRTILALRRRGMTLGKAIRILREALL
jgi:hypothetical protein